VNRNMVGAVVGVQPFGGEGLSGTGPKAGGPLYLYRLLSQRPDDVLARSLDGRGAVSAPPARQPEGALAALMNWASLHAGAVRKACVRMAGLARTGESVLLPGPTGERNVYTIVARSAVLCLASGEEDRLVQLAAVLAVGSRAIWPVEAEGLLQGLPAAVQAQIAVARDWTRKEVAFDSVLLHGSREELASVQHQLARREGPVLGVERLEPGDANVPLERLVIERALSINTAAAGGNASLMTIA
jgi:RHH-type transcriptional regulator, proline utilization regulon repressor / proline dehydrogenase / delta 1-pyrroline-5-carboxylate dehydrogenase